MVLEDSTESAQARALARVRPAVEVHPELAIDAENCAGLVTRVLAFTLDSLIINGVALFTGVAIGLGLSVLHLPHDLEVAIAAVGGFVWIVWSVAYFVFFWSSTGQTPGNRVMRIRVVDARGGDALRPRRTLLRFGALIIAAIPLLAGIWMMLWDERRRCLQDRLAATLVIYEPDEEPVQPGHRLTDVEAPTGEGA
jgi:uncharacterized RDD family membrane protein YckC